MAEPALRAFRGISQEEIPRRVAALPRDHRGWPVPVFVQRPPLWQAGQPIDFRIIDEALRLRMINRKVCWICGGVLGAHKAFIGGPLSTAQGLYADFPSHRDCAQFAVKVCPFLAVPAMSRRPDGLPHDLAITGPMLVADNPEVSGLLIATHFEIRSGVVAVVPPVISIDWYSQGRAATRAEVETAIRVAGQRAEVQNSPAPARVEILRRLGALPLPAA